MGPRRSNAAKVEASKAGSSAQGASGSGDGARAAGSAIARRGHGGQKQGAGAAGLLDLPTPVLELVFDLLPDAASKQALRQSCKKLEAVARGFSGVWGASAHLNAGGELQAQLAAGGAAAKRSWLEFLRRRAAALTVLRVTSSSVFAPHVAPVLTMMAGAASPSALGALFLDLHSMTTRQSQRLLRAVGALTSLQDLGLEAAALDHGCWDVSGAELLLALGPLRGLRRLHVNAYFRGSLPCTVFDSLTGLTSLTMRQLLYAAEPTLTGAALAAAGSAVGGLRALDLCGFRLVATGEEVALALPTLGSMRLHHVWAEEETFAALPQLARLSSVILTGGIFHQPSQATVAVLTQCSALVELSLERYWQGALPDLPPGALPGLTRLRVARASALDCLPRGWCAALGRGLRQLELDACFAMRTWPPELAALSALRHLDIRYCHLEVVPPQVVGLSRLTRLGLSANALEELPPGPYLGTELLELQLATNGLRRVPPALRSAASLRALDLSFNWQLALGPPDVVLLRGMTALTELDLRRRGGWALGPPARSVTSIRTVQRELGRRGVLVLTE